MSHSIYIFRRIIGAALAVLVVTALPTGWLYDLWAETGTEQGQWSGGDVRRLQRQEDIEICCLGSIPVTVSGGRLAACPLARLRDAKQAGTHSRYKGGAKSSVYVSEYITAGYPFSPWEYALQQITLGGFYNRYYLMELGDRSWLCVYLDDYLALIGTDVYPIGYVRHTTTEERRMLNRMTEGYDVNSVYVLDMYRHGKVSWMLDLGLRLTVVLAGYIGAAAVAGLYKKRKTDGFEARKMII